MRAFLCNPGSEPALADELRAVTDAIAVLDAAGWDRSVIVACSMGGQAAVDLVLAHPDRTAGLVLIGTAIRGAPYPELVHGPTAELNHRIEVVGGVLQEECAAVLSGFFRERRRK